VFGIGIAGVLVRVPAHGEFAVRRFDRRIVRAALHFEQFVIVGFYGHHFAPHKRPSPVGRGWGGGTTLA
jgi:hypothetical protein